MILFSSVNLNFKCCFFFSNIGIIKSHKSINRRISPKRRIIIFFFKQKFVKVSKNMLFRCSRASVTFKSDKDHNITNIVFPSLWWRFKYVDIFESAEKVIEIKHWICLCHWKRRELFFRKLFWKMKIFKRWTICIPAVKACFRF